MPFPITLESCFFTRLCVIANPDYEGSQSNGVQVDANSTIDIALADEAGTRYLATQRVQLGLEEGTGVPYEIDVECVGFFQVDEELEEHERKAAVVRVAHNVLYSATREAILTATARQPWGPFCIPIALLKTQEDAVPTKAKPKAQKKKTA